MLKLYVAQLKIVSVISANGLKEKWMVENKKADHQAGFLLKQQKLTLQQLLSQ